MTLCCHQPFLFWPCPFGLQPAVCPANDAHDAALSVQTSPVTSVAMSSWLFTAALLSLLCACSVSVAFWCCNSKTFGQTLTSRRVCGFVWFLFHCPLSSATWRTELCLAVRCINALFCLDYWVNRCCMLHCMSPSLNGLESYGDSFIEVCIHRFVCVCVCTICNMNSCHFHL